ncbi:MAG: DHA2 family efflux MFS transporter permease subunit [Chloroflexota bacterium]
MERLRANPWVVLLVLCMGFFMILLDVTIVNIAIPSIITSLNASLDEILWVLNAYILAYAVLLITFGRLGDLFGQRNVFMAGLAVFTVASAISGLAQDTNQLVAARVLQGIGGAMLTPQTLAMLTSVFPPERRGAAFGVWGAVAGVAAIAGPTLGGLIINQADWRWIFYVNIPIGVGVLIAAYLLLPTTRFGRQWQLDLVGVGLSTVALFLITFALIEGEHFAWGTVWGFITIPGLIVAGLAVLALFVLWERGRPQPLVPLSLFRDRNYSVMNWVSAVLSFSMIGMFLPLTIYLQSVLGLSALSAGLTLAPMSLASLTVAPLSGHLSDRIGGKWILVFGLVLYAAGMGLIAWLATTTSDWTTFLGPLLLAGVGQGCVFPPITTIALRDITPMMAGAASGVLNTTRQVGGVMGSAVVGAVLQNQLVLHLREQATAQSVQLPPQLRAGFVEGFANAVRGGYEVGGAGAAANLPPGLPAPLAEQIGRVAQAVFQNGFVDAMRPTLALPLAVLLIGALSCLAIVNDRRARQTAPLPTATAERHPSERFAPAAKAARPRG